MTAAAPALNTEFIVEGVANLLGNATHYLSPMEFRYLRLVNEAEKLVKADAMIGFLALALTHQIVGDVKSVQQNIDKAWRICTNPQIVADVAVTCCVNLGQFAAARNWFVKAADPQSGQFSRMFDKGMSCGAFRDQVIFEEAAMRMHIDLDAFTERHQYRHAAQVLNQTGTTDEEVSALLDIAGELLRERSLFFVGPKADLCVLDDIETDHCVFLTFAVNEPPETVTEMMFELADRAADRLPRIPPGFGVGFSSLQS